MSQVVADPQETVAPDASRPGRARLVHALLAALLVVLVLVSGWPAIDAPFIQGDEYRFIAKYADVTGAGYRGSPLQRYGEIFLHPHHDLYQPIPILTYALEHDLAGEHRATVMRLVDILLHALNGLLLWGVLRRLLRFFVNAPPSRAGELIAYALALLWTLHPVHVSAYAADMGRTHLLSAGFALGSLWLYLRGMERGGWRAQALSMLLLLGAMLCKPIVGWFILLGLLEWQRGGWWAALRAPCVWLALLLGLAFGYLTLIITADYIVLEDIEFLMYGDPVSRSFYAVWLYVRNALVPLWLSPWYLPAPQAVWSHPTVWYGVALTLASLVIAGWAWWRPKWRGVAFGIVWAWVLVLPVIGLVGARVASANDRYVYLPLMGIVFAVALLLRQRTQQATAAATRRLVTATLIIAIGLSALLVPLNRQLTPIERSSIQRGQRIVSLYPEHPGAWEVLNIAYEFSATHDTYARRALGRDALLQKAREVLDDAVAQAEANPDRFSTAFDRAFFNRRVSFRYQLYGQYDKALEHLKITAAIEPNSPGTLTRFAQVHRARGEFEQARNYYDKLEQNMPPGYRYRAKRLIEYADLLLHTFGDAAAAIPRFVAALQDPTLQPEDVIVAQIGLALAEIRDTTGVGEGARGHALIIDVIEHHPSNRAAKFVLGEYLLRSHEWTTAEAAYRWLVDQDPTDYRALRGLHEAYAQQDRYGPALDAWNDALQLRPESRIFRSFLAWTAACADDPGAGQVAEGLLALDPNNPLARMAQGMIATRAGEYQKAVKLTDLARFGRPIPDERPAMRAAATIEQEVERGQLPPAALTVGAHVWLQAGRPDRALRLLDRYVDGPRDPEADAVAAELRKQLGSRSDSVWQRPRTTPNV